MWKTPCLGGSSPGVDGQGYCVKGHYGPLCELCNQSESPESNGNRKYFSNDLAHCIECPDPQNRAILLAVVITIALIFIGVIAFILYKMKTPEYWRELINRGRRAVLLAGNYALMPKAKILMALHQSIAAIPDVYSVLLSPWYYEKTEPVSDPFNINWDTLVVPGSCLKLGRWSSFHSRLVLKGIVPFVVISVLAFLKFIQPYVVSLMGPVLRRAAIASVPYLERAKSSSSPKLKKFGTVAHGLALRASEFGSAEKLSKQEEKLARSLATRLYDLVPLILLVLFSFCATVSKGVFSSWDCVQFEVSHEAEARPRYFLRSDMSIECRNGDPDFYSPEYQEIETTAWFLLIVWPVLMPIFFISSLIPIRKDLMQRRNTRLVRATAFLHKEYEPAFFWWEPFNVFQRLVMIGFVQLIKAEWMRLQIGLVITIIYTLALLYFKPCAFYSHSTHLYVFVDSLSATDQMPIASISRPSDKRDDIDVLAIGAQVCLLGVFLGALNIKLYADLAAMDNSASSLSNTTVGDALAGDVTGFESQRQAEIALIVCNFVTLALFVFSTIYLSANNDAPNSVREVGSSLPPELGLQPENTFHVFLSYAWSSGQDQVAVIKRQLQYANCAYRCTFSRDCPPASLQLSLAFRDVVCRLLLPGVKVFLDIDDLDNTDHLEQYIEQSQTVLIFLSKGYFFSKNCLRELDCALSKGKPLILVHEADFSRGGASLTTLKAECESKQRMQVFVMPDDVEDNSDDSPVKAREIITWQRLSHFQLVCMREICAAIIHATPGYEKLSEPPNLFVPGEVSFQAFTFPHIVKLHVSPHNPGAWALAEEFKEHCDSWQEKRTIAAQSKTLEINEGLHVQSIETSTSPPPSPPNLDIEDVAGVDASPNPNVSEVTRVELPPDDGCVQASVPRKLVYPQQNVDQSTVSQAPTFLKMLKGWRTQTNLNSGYKVRHVEATHFLLYLNKHTFVGEEGAQLAEEVRLAIDGGLPMVLVHEEDPAMDGCHFDELHHNTPEDLTNQGLYKNIAISCKPERLRLVSLSLIAKALGAVPVLTRLEEVVHSPKRAIDNARKSMKTGAAEMSSKVRLSGSLASPKGSSPVLTRLSSGLSSARRSLSISTTSGKFFPSSRDSGSDVNVENEASIMEEELEELRRRREAADPRI